jgi:hypothetical protein
MVKVRTPTTGHGGASQHAVDLDAVLDALVGEGFCQNYNGRIDRSNRRIRG